MPVYDPKTFAQALLAGTPLGKLIAEFGALPEEDRAIDLSTVAPETFPSIIGSKVLPTPGVAKYLATDDILTNATINLIEQSMERDYAIPTGFAITSHRTGKGKNFKLHYFYLIDNKFFLFSELGDGTQNVLVQSSANFTNPQLRNQNNLVIIRNDKAIYDAYRIYWHDMERQVANPAYDRIAIGETSTEARFSPRADANGATGLNDPVVEELTRVASGPETRIRVAMAYWTNARRAIANRLIALHDSDTDVAVILYSTEVDAEILQLLRSAGVPVFLSPLIHSKYLLIERAGKTRVLTGSHNYTGNALRSNDEVLLSLDSPELHRQFNEDWEFMKRHPQTSH